MTVTAFMAVTVSGIATCQINSPTAGFVTINGTTTFTVSAQSLTRDTDPATAPTSGPGGSGPVTKQYVDARINLGEQGNHLGGSIGRRWRFRIHAG